MLLLLSACARVGPATVRMLRPLGPLGPTNPADAGEGD